MDGLELLKTEHQRVDELFNEIESESDISKKKNLYKEINSELTMHAHIEEKVLYPYFSDKEDFKRIVEDAFDEHQEAKSLLQEIDQTNEENKFDNLIGELVKLVRHHVKDEEAKFFPKIRKVLKNEELEVLGDKLQAAKQTPIDNTLAA